MTQKQEIQLFEDRKVRSVWDSEQEKWYISVVDVCHILTDQPDYDHAKNYWKVLKHRLIKEGNESVTNCNQLKLVSPKDGKAYKTDVADVEQLFRLIQSIPSPKAEPFKLWMAQVASQRLDQMQDPELSIDQAIVDYKRLGYSDKWINSRIKGIEVRKELTDEWDRAGVKQGQQYASLTDIITKEWSGMTMRQYKQHKGLKKENLRDNMSNVELALNMLAEASTVEISKQKNPQGFQESAQVAKEGGSVAKAARKQLESTTGKSAISASKASDFLLPVDNEMKTKSVVAAVIIQNGKIFATQRGYGDWKGWWEFPGGKIEPDETPQDALRREIREELATDVSVGDLIHTVEYDYPKFHLSMQCFLCTIVGDAPTLLEHEAARWLPKEDLQSVQWLPADVEVLSLIEPKLTESCPTP